MSRPLKLTLSLDPETGSVQMSGPLGNIPVCHYMLTQAQGMLFKRALETDPKDLPGARKVRTLDELGVSAGARVG